MRGLCFHVMTFPGKRTLEGRQQISGCQSLAGVTLDWEKPGVISASETCGGTLRGPSSLELAAVPMPDDRARMENAKKEKVAHCLTWF